MFPRVSQFKTSVLFRNSGINNVRSNPLFRLYFIPPFFSLFHDLILVTCFPNRNKLYLFRTVFFTLTSTQNFLFILNLVTYFLKHIKSDPFLGTSDSVLYQTGYTYLPSPPTTPLILSLQGPLWPSLPLVQSLVTS